MRFNIRRSENNIANSSKGVRKDGLMKEEHRRFLIRFHKTAACIEQVCRRNYNEIVIERSVKESNHSPDGVNRLYGKDIIDNSSTSDSCTIDDDQSKQIIDKQLETPTNDNKEASDLQITKEQPNE